jgi:hypothetical protein
MANQAANRFVKQLIAAFSRYPTSKETAELYAGKLSIWRLTQNEWDDALDKIIKEHQEENLPQLAEIYRFLRNQTAAAHSARDLGWLHFESGGLSYGVRVKYDGGLWVNHDVAYTDEHGNRMSVQRNPGRSPQLPLGATNIVLTPDNMDYIHTDEGH